MADGGQLIPLSINDLRPVVIEIGNGFHLRLRTVRQHRSVGGLQIDKVFLVPWPWSTDAQAQGLVRGVTGFTGPRW